MSGKNASFGVFPSQSAVRSMSQPDISKLYFASTKQNQFSWRTQTAEDVGENFDAIHSMGKKNTKYMRYQAKTAPLLNNTACKYYKDYAAKPLGDHLCNRELAENFKAGSLSKTNSTPSFGLKSNYQETHQHYDRQQIKSAKLPSQGPKVLRTHTLGGTGDNMVLTSHSHTHHKSPASGFGPSTEAIQPKPNLTLAGQVTQGAFRSAHKRAFTDPSEVSPSPQMEQFDMLPPGFARSDDMFNLRRACCFSPGQ